MAELQPVFCVLCKWRDGEGDGTEVTMVGGGSGQPSLRRRSGRYRLEPIAQGIHSFLLSSKENDVAIDTHKFIMTSTLDCLRALIFKGNLFHIKGYVFAQLTDVFRVPLVEFVMPAVGQQKGGARGGAASGKACQPAGQRAWPLTPGH